MCDAVLKSLKDKALQRESEPQRLRSNSKEEEKVDPNVLIHRSIKQELLYVKNSDSLHKICITGGPCAGKTTALADF
jgi:predicted NACHT family NTPase